MGFGLRGLRYPGDFLTGGRAGFWSATVLSALALAAVVGLVIRPRKVA